VVDAGSHSIDMYQGLFDSASAVYLVAQVSVADLRNANRFVTRYFSAMNSEKLEIVLNRYVPRNLEIDDAAITKALTRPPKWTIPNDFTTARNAQNTGIPIASGKNQITRVLGEMAKAAAGQVAGPERKRRFGLFG
jgi:Flp pilus assembly CpaE family ATPase